jgi:hypothetical protein
MALNARYPGSVPAVATLSVTMFLTASSFSLMRRYACFDAGLVQPGIAHRALRQAMCRSLLAPLLYFFGCLAAFVSPAASLAIQVIVSLIFFFPSRLEAASRDPGES